MKIQITITTVVGLLFVAAPLATLPLARPAAQAAQQETELAAPQSATTKTAVKTAAPSNISENGDFEKMDDKLQAEGWGFHLQDAERESFERRQAVQIIEEDGANHYILLKPIGGNTRKIARKVLLSPDWNTLKVSARVMSRGLKEGANPWEDAHIGIVYYDARDKELGFDKAVAPDSDLDWTTMGRVLTIPPRAHHIIIDAANFGTAGEFAIDDLRVEPNGLIDAPLLQKEFFDGTFERLDKAGQPLGWPLKGMKGIHLEEEKGNHFLRIDNPIRDNEVGVDAFWKLDPRVRELRFRARVRGRNIKRGPNPWDTGRLSPNFTDAAGLTIYGLPPFELNKDSAWRTEEFFARVPPGALLKLTAILFYAGGTFDIDDIQIEAVKEIIEPKKRPKVL